MLLSGMGWNLRQVLARKIIGATSSRCSTPISLCSHFNVDEKRTRNGNDAE
jgi:hypothetical protein